MRLALLLILALAAPSMAAGRVFARDVVDVPMPDARALIAWRDGVQTLVVEPRIGGAGTELAWVLALPAKAEVGPVGEGLFPTLEVLFAPELVHDTGAAFLFVLLVLLPLGLAATHGALRRMSLGCALPLAVVVGIALLPLLGARVGPPRLVSSVRQVDRAEVSGYQVTTVGADLGAKLRASGYAVPADVDARAAAHAAAGGVYVIVRARRTASDFARSLHPLRFQFSTPEPVYPLAVGGGDLDLELFVFGPGRAEVDGMRVVRSSRTGRVAEDGYVPLAPTEAIAVEQPTLRALIGKSEVATRLRGRVSTVALRWAPFVEQGSSVYSGAGALGLVLDVWIPIGTALLLVALVWRRLHRQPPRFREPCLVVALAALAGAAHFSVIDRVVVPEAGVSWLDRATRHPSDQRVVGRELADAALRAPHVRLDRAWLAQELRRVAAQGALPPLPWRNPFTGAPVQLRDAPGDLALRRIGNTIRLTTFDAVGRPHAVRVRRR